MRTKKVNRYWCDFCNKAGLSAGAMAKHETHCTMNPDRHCRVCTLINGGSRAGKVVELVALLPAIVGWEADSHGNATPRYIEFCRVVDVAIPALRAAADNCPACIMAALRQAKIPVPMAEGFDFKVEMQKVFANCEPRHGYDY